MIREADLSGTDAVAVGRLVAEYLLQTEREKAEHGVIPPRAADVLEDAHRREADDPATAYAGYRVFVAELDGEASGVVVLRPGTSGVEPGVTESGVAEIKRLWALPRARGRGVGSGLLDAAIAASGGAARLSVWDWRTDVIRLYESRGFVRMPSWESRERLVCMQRG